MEKEYSIDSLDFESEQPRMQYAGVEPVDQKLASLCLKDSVDNLGVTSNTPGECPLTTECTYASDKVTGLKGYCLKATVGVQDTQSPEHHDTYR